VTMRTDQHMAVARFITDIGRRYRAIPYADQERIKRELRAGFSFYDPMGNRPTQSEVVAFWDEEQQQQQEA
jgi:hypothetical protein